MAETKVDPLPELAKAREEGGSFTDPLFGKRPYDLKLKAEIAKEKAYNDLSLGEV